MSKILNDIEKLFEDGVNEIYDALPVNESQRQTIVDRVANELEIMFVDYVHEMALEKQLPEQMVYDALAMEGGLNDIVLSYVHDKYPGVPAPMVHEQVAKMLNAHKWSTQAPYDELVRRDYDAYVDEEAPEGWEGTVKAMKKHKEIDNPYALAHYMKNKGYKSHKKEEVEEDDDDSCSGQEVGACGRQATMKDPPENYLGGQKLVGGS